MFTIETDLGRFEGENEKEAKAKLRKAQAAAKKESAAREERYKLASMRARAAAYIAMKRVMGGEEFPRGWHVYPGGHRYSAVTVKAREHGFAGVLATYHTEYGSADYDHAYVRIVAVASNGAGFPFLVWLQEMDRGHNGEEWPVECYGIGAEGDVVAFAECPGITVEMFAKEAAEQLQTA